MVVLIHVALVVATATSAVQAAEPVEAKDLDELIATLERVEDPRTLFAALSNVEQDKVINYYGLASTETQASDGSTTAAASSSCKTLTVNMVGRNLIGAKLYTYTSRTKWCYNGTEITNDPAFTRKGKTHVWFWDFVGHFDKSESGGEGDWEHEDFTQGHFRACITNICEIDRYPDITKWQYGDGSYDYESDN